MCGTEPRVGAGREGMRESSARQTPASTWGFPWWKHLGAWSWGPMWGLQQVSQLLMGLNLLSSLESLDSDPSDHVFPMRTFHL